MAKLLLVHGPGAGNQYPLESRPLMLGRQPGVELVLDDDGVSRFHAHITCSAGRYAIEDLSSNGTFLNCARLTGKTELNDQDQIQIGPFVFRFDATPAEMDLVIRSEVTMNASNLAAFHQDAASKLLAVLEITQHLARPLDLEVLLPKLLDHLLHLFRQADR